MNSSDRQTPVMYSSEISLSSPLSIMASDSANTEGLTGGTPAKPAPPKVYSPFAPGGPAPRVEYGFAPPLTGLAPSMPAPSRLPAAPPPDVAHKVAQYLDAGNAAYSTGRFGDAFTAYLHALKLQPTNPTSHYRLACAAWRCERLDMVEPHLLEAIRLLPSDPLAHEAISQWYMEEGNLAAASLHSSRAIALAPREVTVAISHAYVLEANGQTDAAMEIVDRLLKSGSMAGRLACLFARIAPKVKREDEALKQLFKVLEARTCSPFEQSSVHFYISNLLDRVGRYDEAFEQVKLANAVYPRPYNPEHQTQRVNGRIKYFTAEKLHDLPRGRSTSRRPVFIIGMPRSGTSLVEQILASHPDVFGAGELNTISKIAFQASKNDWAEGQPYPDYLDSSSVKRIAQMADEYLQFIGKLNSTARYVTDKMPLNFLYVGFIHVLFPEAQIIHCLRNPLDTLLSCYMTDFVAGNSFTRDLKHLGMFYSDYRRLMQHWKDVNLPMVEVRYEDVVEDLEGSARRLLEVLDLPWDDKCLAFHKNPRRVATASCDQVRKPIYNSSVNRWKRYEKYLGELKTYLEENNLIEY